MIYSVIQTALLNNLKPENYLEYVFGQIQINRDTDLNDLMPWSEKIPEECKNKLQK
ncbi:MAG: transposase domain-containing protein [Lachnospiraceae bacterium]|nr:transposase domain-containing protein [Lachnospiraceae bacterium]